MLAPELLPVWGGVGTYIVELLRHLPSDIEIHAVTPLRESIGHEQISSRDFDYSHYFGNNVHVHFISTANDTFVYNAKFQLACLKEIPKIVKEEKIDLIHSHTANMPDLLLQFRGLNVPTVTTIPTTICGQRNGTKDSGMNFSGLEKSEKITCLTYPLLGLLEKIYFLKKRQYITVSDWMKQQISQLYPTLGSSSIDVIHNSVDTGLFYPSKNDPLTLYYSLDVSLQRGWFWLKLYLKFSRSIQTLFSYLLGLATLDLTNNVSRRWEYLPRIFHF